MRLPEVVRILRATVSDPRPRDQHPTRATRTECQLHPAAAPHLSFCCSPKRTQFIPRSILDSPERRLWRFPDLGAFPGI